MKHLWIAILVLFLGLPVPVWAHGGEKHEDLRDAQEHEAETGAAAVPAGPPRTSTAQFGAYTVVFRQVPANPEVGQQVQVEIHVKKKVDPPDPLLGPEMTVEGAKVSVTRNGQTLEAHAEKEPGSYGVHFPVSSAGQQRLEWVLQQDQQPEARFPYTFAVARPLKQTIAWAVAGTALGAMAIFTLVRRRFLWGGWIAALTLSGGALGYAYYPRQASAPVAATRTTQTTTASERGLLIPVALQRDLEMSIEPVRLRELPNSLRVPGTLRIPEGATHNLHARFPSRILTETPRVGRVYERGQEIAVFEEVLSTADRASLRGQTIDLQARQLEFATRQVELRRQLAELESQRRVAASQVIQRRLDLRRSEQLYAIQAVPLKELQAARTAYNQSVAELRGLERQQQVVRQSPPIPELPPPTGLQQYSLTAPVRGVISQVEAAQGEVVEPSKVLFTLVDLSRLWVEARVSEADLAAARGAGRANVSTVAYPGPFVARFVSVAPGLDPETRTARVYYELDNRQGQLLEGMSAEVEIAGRPERALTVPSEALQTYDRQSRVFVKIDDDRFEARSVKVLRTAGNVSVIEGEVEAGTPVVVKGAGALASELARQEERQSATASGTPAPGASATPGHADDGHTH